MALLLAAVLTLGLTLSPGAVGFGILPGDSKNHLEITEEAMLNATVYACRALAQIEGTDFTFPSQPYTQASVAAACGATLSSKAFAKAIKDVIKRNVRVDIRHALNSSFHFDDESFAGGKAIITEGMSAIKASNKEENYEAARETLGEILHPTQDFYSHSNWREIGNTGPNANLIRPDTSIGNIAAPTRATCRNCDGDNCKNNILDDIIAEQVLTSGYFSLDPFSATKPNGKCSHGGAVDMTSTIEPKGGINKDSLDSSHGYLHIEAAGLAIAATSQLLEDIRAAAGDKQFLQMMGIFTGSSKALCFVIDVTKSMSDDIEAVKSVTTNIIDTEVGTDNEPSVYILVPFSDPDVGPLTKTTDPNVFKTAINDLSPTGGGDEAEMSLSGLQLGLTTAPFNSEIFLFTDAGAKDQNLRSTLVALIERSQTVVNFLITDSPSINRRRRSTPRISTEDLQLYKDLAQTSGGQGILVSKSDLSIAASIITESSINSMVTVLQTERSPGVTETFSFTVDQSMTKVIIYLTGNLGSISFTLTSPSGVTQSTPSGGSLIESSVSVGNFQTLRLTVQWGEWKLRVDSSNAYTVKVIGQSPIDLLVDFVEESQGPFGGYDSLETRPKVGAEGFIVVTVTGSSSATVTLVDLVEAQGSNTVSGTIQPQEGSYLVKFAAIPAGQFVVLVKGTDGPSVFQRQSPTSFTASNITITANADNLLTPGTPFVVPFTVMSSEVGVSITIRATNNRGFDMTYPPSLVIENGNSTNGTVTLSAPLNTPSGSDVTLTIMAETSEGDNNYVVQRFSVFNTVTDFSAPVCELLSLQNNCSVNCSQYLWSFSARISDSGTGVERVTLKEGNGTFTTEPDPQNSKNTLVSYSASCCTPSMQMQAVDKVGNVATCTISYNDVITSPSSLAPKITQPSVLTFITSFIFIFFTLTK